MKKILVPTDFSENAQLAIDYAANLARKISGEIYLLHVVENEDDYSSFNASGEWNSYVTAETVDVPTMLGVLKVTGSRMKDIMNQPVLEGIPVYDNIEVGTPGIHIDAAAEKYKTDMIIMGTHGASGLAEVLIGSNAEKVVQLATRPVITIREKSNVNPQKIVFATDFSSEADEVFPAINDFADIYKAEIHFLTVNTKERFESYLQSEKKINEFRERHNSKDYPFTIYNDHSKEAGILHFTKDIKADMIAIGSHGRSGLGRFFNRSISEELVNHSFCPVLTVNFKKAK
jgi:nucleotide-binding universal stress UspA family protein